MTTRILESTPAQLAGPLSEASLVQVLRALFVGRLTGTLSLSRDKESLSLRFLSGHVVSGTSGPVEGRLGEILVRSGIVSRRDLDRALEQAARESRRLGPVLAGLGLATRGQIEEGLRLQARGVLFTAFSWGRGAFLFLPDDGAAASLEEVSLKLCTAQLILDVVNGMGEPLSVREALGNLDRPLAAVDDPAVRLEGVTLSPADAFVLSRADGALTAREILDITPLPRETVERSLLSLLSVGVVEWKIRHRARLAARPNETVALSRDAVREAIAAKRDEMTSRIREVDAVFSALGGKTHHDVLGVARTATGEEIRVAYKQLTRRFHPDVTGDLPAEQGDRVQAIFMRISEAYNALRAVPAVPAVAPRRAAAPVRTAEGAGAKPEALATLAAVAAPPARAVDTEESLREAEAALGDRPWEALAVAERILEHASGVLRRQAMLLRARAKLRNQVSQRAGEQELHQLLREAPQYVDAWMTLATFYKDRGLAARSGSMLKKVLALDPAHRRALAASRELPLPLTGPMSFERLASARA